MMLIVPLLFFKGHFACRIKIRKSMWKRKLLKPAQKFQYCIEKTCKVELQSSDSDLDDNNKNIMFVSCHVGITARNN